MARSDMLDSAVEAIYEATLTSSLWPMALHKIAECTNDVGAVLIWQRATGDFGTIASPKLAKAQEAYAEHWWQHDVRAQRAVESAYWATSEVVTDSDLITRDEMETLPIYTSFLSSFGLKYVASVGVSTNPKLQAAVTVQRGVGRQPFDEDERAVIGQLGRHVEKALRIGSRIIELQDAQQTLGESLRRAGFGVITLDEDHNVAFINSEGERLLGDVLVKRGNTLFINDGGRHISVDAAFKQSTRDLRDVASSACFLARGQRENTVALFLLPFTVSSDIEDVLLRESRLLLLAIDQNASGQLDPTILRDLFGLTTAEARLGVIVGRGISPRAAAKSLRITEGTARSVLKRIFSKTGTTRQSEFTALVSSVGLRK